MFSQSVTSSPSTLTDQSEQIDKLNHKLAQMQLEITELKTVFKSFFKLKKKKFEDKQQDQQIENIEEKEEADWDVLFNDDEDELLPKFIFNGENGYRSYLTTVFPKQLESKSRSFSNYLKPMRS
jgi:TolA-binding protein